MKGSYCLSDYSFTVGVQCVKAKVLRIISKRWSDLTGLQNCGRRSSSIVFFYGTSFCNQHLFTVLLFVARPGRKGGNRRFRKLWFFYCGFGGVGDGMNERLHSFIHLFTVSYWSLRQVASSWWHWVELRSGSNSGSKITQLAYEVAFGDWGREDGFSYSMLLNLNVIKVIDLRDCRVQITRPLNS